MADGGERGGRAPRARTWVGVAALAAGCYTVGDTADRARNAVEVASSWWPWALLGLAALNVLRSAVATDALIGPLVLGAVALAGLATGLSGETVQNVVVPAGLAAIGVAILLSAGRDDRTTRWSRVLSTGRVIVPADAGALLTVRAVLGELRADLTGVAAERVTVHVTAVAGHVRLTVPRACPVRIHRTGAALTRVSTSELQPPLGKGGLTVHVLGLCGAVSIVRV
ncbi:hypothetical protein [Streptomyces umbrinus]|uniref:hypothetical protein n=1 Tax=Streptomyces umbrinus TaxID=67370 RepID=UPI0033CBA7FB